MSDLLSIPCIRNTQSGIHAIVIFTPENVASSVTSGVAQTITFNDTDQVYSIAFTSGSARFNEEARSGDGGDYYESTLSAFIPERRIEMETLIRSLRNRRVHAIYIDRNGRQWVHWNTRFFYQFDSGDQRGTKSGYTIQFKTKNVKRIPIISGNEDLPTPPPPNTGGDSCCITIEPSPVVNPPTPTGNTENLNKIVTLSDGTPYFIDKFGRSVLLGRPAPVYIRIPTTPDGLLTEITLPSGTIPDPADFAAPTYDERIEMSRRVFIKSSSRWIAYDPPQPYTGGWTCNIDQNGDHIYFDEPPRGAFIEIYIWSFPDKQIQPPIQPETTEN